MKKWIPNYIGELNEYGRVTSIKNPILYRAWKRNHWQDKDTLVAVCGETGSRKSGSAITLSLALDVIPKVANEVPNINQFYSPLMTQEQLTKFTPHSFPNDNSPYWTRFSKFKVFYLATDIIKIINSRPPLPSGTALIWDEVGVEADARDFMTLKNKLVNHIFRTVRQFNFYFFITTPTLKDFDIGFMRNMKAYLEMDADYVHSNKALGKFMWVQVNPRYGKAYIKKMRFLHDVNAARIDKFYIPRPPAWIEKPYKKWKEQSAQVLYKQMDSQIQRVEEFLKVKHSEERYKSKHWREYLSEAIENVSTLINPRNNRVTASLVEESLEGINDYQAKKLASHLNIMLYKKEISL